MLETLKPLKTRDVLFDRDMSDMRIRERPRDFYGIRKPEDLLLHPEDFRKAEEMCNKEQEIVLNGDHVITEDGFFRGVTYCLLTPMQEYSGLMRGFNTIFGTGMSLEDMDESELATALTGSGIMFPSQKAGKICRARDELSHSDQTLSIIRCNIGSTREIEEIVRDITMQEFHGLGLKTSSLLLRMCGADYLVPVDSWMLEMLYFHGYPCEVPTRLVERERWETKDRSYLKRRKKSLTREQYLQAERCAIDLANKYGVSGYLLQMAIWSKFSSFRKRQNLAKAALH